MLFLTILSYLSIFIQIVFITIGIAAGLYYLAELVEEYSTIAKKCIWWTNSVITVLYVMLWIFENFPSYLVICGVLAQVAHLVILQKFPTVSFTSPEFILAILFLILNHYFAFQFFGSQYYPFSEVIAYFTLFLWLVPFSLFISLSANDFVLPTTIPGQNDDVVSNYLMKNKKLGLLTFFSYAKQNILPVRTKKIY